MYSRDRPGFVRWRAITGTIYALPEQGPSLMLVLLLATSCFWLSGTQFNSHEEIFYPALLRLHPRRGLTIRRPRYVMARAYFVLAPCLFAYNVWTILFQVHGVEIVYNEFVLTAINVWFVDIIAIPLISIVLGTLIQAMHTRRCLL